MPEDLSIPEKPQPIREGINSIFGVTKESKGPFANFIKTTTGSNGYETENAKKSFKLLQLADVASENAINGLPSGVAVSTIHGDTAMHCDGTRTEMIKQEDYLIVMQQLQHTIFGDANYYLNKARNLVIVEEDNHTVHGGQQVFVVGESDHQFMGKHEVKAPEIFEWKTNETGYTRDKFESSLAETGIFLLIAEFVAVDASLKGVEVFKKDLWEALVNGKGNLWERAKSLFKEGEEEEETAEAAEEGTTEAATEGATEAAAETATAVGETAAVAGEAVEAGAVVAEGAEVVGAVAVGVVAAPEIAVAAVAVGAVVGIGWLGSKLLGDSGPDKGEPPADPGMPPEDLSADED